MENSNKRGPEDILNALVSRILLQALSGLPDGKAKVEVDENPKDQGDIVCLIDSPVSAFITSVEDGKRIFDITVQDKELRDRMDVFAQQEFIVIDTDADHKFNCGVCDQEHTADLRIGSMSTRKEYYVEGNLVKVIR